MARQSEREILAFRAVIRASSGLYFIEECLRNSHGGTDPAYSRSRYILLSYNFELLLKARLILVSKHETREDIVTEIITHNLTQLFKKFPKGVTSDIGIVNISKRQNNGFGEYVIEMTDKTIIVMQDFIDIRYDFDKDILRSIDNDEVNRLQHEIKTMHGIAKKILAMIPEPSLESFTKEN